MKNLQTNHPELADALGMGTGTDAKSMDTKKLVAVLPMLQKLKTASDKDPQYFKTLSGELDEVKQDAPQTYAQIVDTARNHPEKLADTIQSASDQFNMVSKIKDYGNQIGNYLGMGNLGDMLGGLMKWLANIPVIGPMITGMLTSTLGGLFNAGQSGDLEGSSNTNFSLAHERCRGRSQDANNQRVYTLKGKLDTDQTSELAAMLKKDNAADTYNYDKSTDTTTVKTTTKFQMPQVS